MTCFTKCGSGCCPNTPEPIRVIGRCSNTNNVVNPIILSSFGFFENNLGGTVTANAIIPVTLTSSQGDNVSGSTTTAGAITLTTGTYEITYNVDATIPTLGTMSVGLRLNGTNITGSTSAVSGTAGNQGILTKSIIVTVPQTSTLELYNAGSENLTISSANVIVKEI